MEYQVGNFDQGDVYLERLGVSHLSPSGGDARYSMGAFAISCLAHSTGVLDQLEVATHAAESIISSATAARILKWHAKMAFGLIAVVRGDEGAAQAQYVALLPNSGTMSPMGTISTDR